MKDLRDILADHELFRSLDDEYLALLAGCAQNVTYPADTEIFREGEPADRFWLIRRGRVAIEVDAPGRGPLVVETLGTDDVLGWSWIVPPYRWHFGATTREATGAVAFDATCVRRKLSSDPKLAAQLFERFLPVVVRRLQASRLRLLDLYGHVGAHG
jgi:CRP/FNR family transcriptional regulator, cyclic AMP receptor protein